ncbi:MAG: methylmalonyl-CoA mutase family protein, partial [Ilumatobacteraceae bacterium]
MTEKQTDSGISVEPLYTADSLSDFDAAAKLGLPGEAPFTRGIYKTMHRDRLWTMRQYAGFCTAADTNERFKFLM